MNGISGGFELNGLLCYPKLSEQYCHYFVPLRPDLERNANGRVMFTLIRIGAGGYLTLSAVWRAEDAALTSLRDAIGKRDAIVDPTAIKLEFAPTSVKGCNLLLGDGTELSQVIATSTTSGQPPYSALFNVRLSADQFASAAAAAEGRAGFLGVEYDAEISAPIGGTGTLIPQSPGLVTWLLEYRSAGEAGFRSAIEEAIDDGLAAVRVSVPHDPAGRLTCLLYEHVLSRAAAVLPESLDANRETDFDISVSLVDIVRRPFRAVVDLSSLLRSSGAVVVDGERTPDTEARTIEATSQPLRVGLGFRHTDAPLSWVRIRSSLSDAVLKGPGFAPVEVRVDREAEFLALSVGYTLSSTVGSEAWNSRDLKSRPH